MKSLLIISFVGFLFACGTKSSDQTKATGQKLNSTVANPVDTTMNKRWLGTWTFTDNAPIDYTLTIGEPENEMYVCTYQATGVQTAYELSCLGLAKGNVFELYYQGVNEGAFFQEDKINRDKPVLTLKMEEGKVVTYWDQLINNYVEQGNHSGMVCFEKQ